MGLRAPELLITQQMTQDDSPMLLSVALKHPPPALATVPRGAGGASITIRGPRQGLAHPIHTPAGTSALPLGGAALGREAQGSEVLPVGGGGLWGLRLSMQEHGRALRTRRLSGLPPLAPLFPTH